MKSVIDVINRNPHPVVYGEVATKVLDYRIDNNVYVPLRNMISDIKWKIRSQMWWIGDHR